MREYVRIQMCTRLWTGGDDQEEVEISRRFYIHSLVISPNVLRLMMLTAVECHVAITECCLLMTWGDSSTYLWQPFETVGLRSTKWKIITWSGECGFSFAKLRYNMIQPSVSINIWFTSLHRMWLFWFPGALLTQCQNWPTEIIEASFKGVEKVVA